MNNKLKSRKLWLAVIGAVCSLIAAATGAIEWKFAIGAILTSFGGFVIPEGLADILGRLKK